MKKNLSLCLYCILLSVSSVFLLEAKPLTTHHNNFYLFEKEDELFYPLGVNAGYLLHSSRTERQIQKQINRLANAGANTLRINIDHARTSEPQSIEKPCKKMY